MNSMIPFLKSLYLISIIPGIIAFIYQLFFIEHNTDVNIDFDHDAQIDSTNSFELKISWTFICNFLLCFGIIGYILYPSIFSLPIAILSGFAFAYGFAYLIFYIHSFCKESENIVPRLKKGSECISTTSLDSIRVGTVDVKINKKTYEYLAKSIDHDIRINTVCIIDRIEEGILFVKQKEEENNGNADSN